MASRGKQETDRLKSNLEDTLNRLLEQLKDLESLKDELDPEEYESTKKDTIQQLKEFNGTLARVCAGNVSLVDQFGSVQLAIQAAVSEAFRTPEVIALFAKKQPRQLRFRLSEIQRGNVYTHPQQALEILAALKKLGEELSPEESHFLSTNMTTSLADFERVSSQQISSDYLNLASAQINRAQK
eukprot:TRINITY_DN4622_c0_g1_i1.p1 TRINITY_DN4622_c0_g1~~TRINITY_DN4622_c0_g1_i1.p1  ORF type:complete len:184 (-),score=46.91 TRINITY_DN4622_c0_g1_i1:24-575(-)